MTTISVKMVAILDNRQDIARTVTDQSPTKGKVETVVSDDRVDDEDCTVK